MLVSCTQLGQLARHTFYLPGLGQANAYLQSHMNPPTGILQTYTKYGA